MICIAALALIAGCGKDVADRTDSANGVAAAPAATAATSQATVATEASAPAPTDIVGQFLDALRRGNAQTPIEDLLTSQAREACRSQQLTVQALGSADATFEITRGQTVPGEENACLVHCLWNEPTINGEMAQYQLVWALRKEAPGWRISGVVAQMAEDQQPLMIDFEDPAALAAHFGPNRNGIAEQAASGASDAALSR